jgi:hypothetical protein
MKHISKLYIIITFIILLLLSSSIIFFAKESKKDKMQELSHYLAEEFREGLAYENADLLSFSLALSENGALKNALISENEQQAYEILSEITKRFKEYTHIKTLRIQLLDNEFFIFAQSWGNTSTGLPLWWFRDDLDQLKKNKKPKVGMETGRRLTFKATIPILNGKEYIGYLEVIKFVDEFTEKLHQEGIELFTLMKKKYLKQASLMQDFSQVKNYVIANKNYNVKLQDRIEFIDWTELNSLGYYYEDNFLYLLEPMYNGEQEEIGKYLIILPPETLKRYKDQYQNISTITRLRDEDLYKVVQSWQNPSGSYKSIEDKELIELLPKLRDEDKVTLLEDAKNRLQHYNKTELIDIILEQKHQEPKRGEIQ